MTVRPQADLTRATGDLRSEVVHHSVVDAERVVELVGALHGVELTLEGRCPGGEVGAYFARSADGGRLVFKWSQRPEMFPVLVDLVEVLGRLHDDGYPLPRYGPVLAIDGGVFVAQEAVDGVVTDVVTHSLLDRLVECIEMQSGRGGPGGGETWGAFVQRTLVEGADGWALHEPLRQHSAATRELLDRIEHIGRAVRPAVFSDDDLMHIDFHHRNVMQTPGGDVRAVIDWEGARGGDRTFDLVTLAFGLTMADCEPGVERRLWSTIAAADPETIVPYVAHMALRHLDWAIRHHPDDVPTWIETSRRHLRTFA